MRTLVKVFFLTIWCSLSHWLTVSFFFVRDKRKSCSGLFIVGGPLQQLLWFTQRITWVGVQQFLISGHCFSDIFAFIFWGCTCDCRNIFIWFIDNFLWINVSFGYRKMQINILVELQRIVYTIDQKGRTMEELLMGYNCFLFKLLLTVMVKKHCY